MFTPFWLTALGGIVTLASREVNSDLRDDINSIYDDVECIIDKTNSLAKHKRK